MHTHRVLAQPQVAGDHLVGPAGAQQRQHIQLPRRERRRVGSAHRGAVAAVDRKTRLAGQRTADGLQDVLGARRLGQKAICTTRTRFVDGIGRHAGGHQHDARLGAGLPQQPQPVQSAHARQLDVQQHQIRVGLLQCAGIGDRAGLGNAAHAGMVLHDQAQPRAEQGVVIHKQKTGSHTGKYCAQPGVAG